MSNPQSPKKPNTPEGHSNEAASDELTPEQLDAISGGRASAEDYVRGNSDPFGIGAAFNNSAGGGGGGGGGREHLAHELTHTNQQRGTRPKP